GRGGNALGSHGIRSRRDDRAHLGAVRVLRRPDRHPVVPSAGALRRPRAGRVVSRTSPLGLARAAVIFGALVAFPFLFPQPWLINMAFFVLMYAALAQ